MAPLKSKIPIYPRPVSPLNAESFHFDPQDVIYATSYSSSDEDQSARAAKRRRIEKLGEQYLRGNGLHILSAGLKGPFDNDWKNPWAKQGRNTKRPVAEIPETAGRPAKKLQVQQSDLAKARSGKVEDWLRRNSAYSGIELEDQSSPTPLCAKLVNVRDAPSARCIRETSDHEGQEPQGRLSSKGETYKGLQHSNIHHHNQQSSPRPPHTADIPPHELPTDVAPIERRAWVSHAANADRAEFAALKSKRSVIHVAPRSTMLSPFEHRRVSSPTQKSRKFAEIADRIQEETESMAPPALNQPLTLTTKSDSEVPDESKHHRGAGSNTGGVNDLANCPQAVITSTSVALPPPSTDTSHASMANLPSAQPQSLAVPSLSTNNLAIDERILEQPMEPADATVRLTRDTYSDEANATPVTKLVNDQENKSTPGDRKTLYGKDNACSDIDQTRLLIDVAREDRSLNTQDMVATISPMAFSTVKANSRFNRRVTPFTVSKRHPMKPTKSASFAQGEKAFSDSSQGSLKTSLKLSKSIALGKENKSFRFGEDETSTHMSDLFTSPVNEFSLPASSPKQLKSALKPSGVPNSTAPLPSTKGSTSIDGGQNAPLVKDETYDLDGTIDELGSYLGTWDAEKEASSLNIET